MSSHILQRMSALQKKRGSDEFPVPVAHTKKKIEENPLGGSCFQARWWMLTGYLEFVSDDRNLGNFPESPLLDRILNRRKSNGREEDTCRQSPGN